MPNDKPITCDGCGGACCREQESPPCYIGYLPGGIFEEDDTDDAHRVHNLPADLIAELEAYCEALEFAHRPHPTYPDCLWLTDGRCAHYELRPDLCRVGVVCGDEACLRWRAKYPPCGTVEVFK